VAGQEIPIIRFLCVCFVHAEPRFHTLFKIIIALVAAGAILSPPQCKKIIGVHIGSMNHQEKILPSRTVRSTIYISSWPQYNWGS